MQLTIETDVVQEAIRVVTQLAPPVAGSVTIEVNGKKAFMHSVAELSRVTVLMPCDVEGSATFAISLDTLRDSTKGRKTLVAKYDKTLLKIRSGNYAAELATTDALTPEQEDDKRTGKPIKLTPEQGQWLKNALATVALKPITILSSFMPVTVKLTDKGAFVACYDTEHMAFLNSKEVQGEMDVTLPLDTLQVILNTFYKAPFKIELGTSNLHVANALVKVAVALPQEEDQQQVVSADDVMTKARAAAKETGLEIEVAKKDILEFLDNARAVATKERGEISVSVEKGKLKLEVVTSNGSTRTAIKAQVAKAAQFKIDFEFLDEAVRKCPELVSMRVVGDAYAMFKTSQAYVLVSLNQE